MSKENMGGQKPQDLAHLQSEEEQAVGAQPQSADTPNVDEMSDAEFLEYLEDITEGGAPESEETEEVSEEEEAAEESSEEEEPFAVFNTKEEYQKDFDERFNKRFKNVKQNEELAAMMDIAREVYGESSDAALIERMKQDILNAGASKEGKNPEEYKGNLEQKKKADAYDRLMQAENDRKNIMDTWTRDAERLKEDYPDFNLEEALSDPAFRESLVNKQRSVAESLLAMMHRAASNKKSPERAISQNASRAQGSSTVRKDPSKMSDAEFDKYIKNIKNDN